MTLRVRTRLTLWHLAVLVAILGAFAAFVSMRLDHHLHAGVDADLRIQVAAVLQQLRTGPAFHLSSLKTVRGTEETFVQILGPDGSVVERTGDSPEDAGVRPSDHLGLSTVRVRDEEGEIRVLVAPLPGGRRLVVGASLQPAADALRDFRVIALLGGLAAVALAGAGAWLLARLALSPVERMRREADAIGASEPSRRLPDPARDDEIGRLARTLNEMLDRLEAGLTRERSFVAEASHDLRTPVSILKSEVELALQGDRSPEELRAALRSAGEEADRLAALAEDLLLLAGPRDHERAIERAPTDLAGIVAASVGRFGALADRGGVALETASAGPVTVSGDRSSLSRIVDNLIDNAIRNSPRGTTVEVSVQARGDRAVVEVNDRGPGVPAELGRRLFEPFHRGNAGYPGVGLGLAIARSLARSLGGDIACRARPGGGSTFVVELPTEPAGAPEPSITERG